MCSATSREAAEAAESSAAAAHFWASGSNGNASGDSSLGEDVPLAQLAIALARKPGEATLMAYAAPRFAPAPEKA